MSLSFSLCVFLCYFLRMLPSILLGFVCGLGSLTGVRPDTGTGDNEGPHPLLLVSFDGFRADYLQRFPMPNLQLLYSQGVLVDHLTNVFVTKTFPNHYSLVTKWGRDWGDMPLNSDITTTVVVVQPAQTWVFRHVSMLFLCYSIQQRTSRYHVS